MRRFLLFLLEGPMRPWWLTPLLLFIGALILFRRANEPSFLADQALLFDISAICLVAVTGWWMLIRRWIRAYYRHLAKLHSIATCPHCGYSLREIPGPQPVCPECGTDAIAFIMRARRLTGVRGWNISR